MEYRKFPGTDLSVSALGLGTTPIGGGYFHRDDGEGLRVIQEAFEQGVTFFDTSDNYSYGNAERLLGQVLSKHRDKVVIASKGAVDYKLLGRLGVAAQPVLGPVVRPFREVVFRRGRRAIGLARNRQKRHSLTAEDLSRAVESSLRRLRTDYLDLYQLHNPRVADFQNSDLMEGLVRLKESGKIRYAGVALLFIEDALAGLNHGGAIDSLMVPMNLFEQEAIQEILPEANRRGIAVIARSPLAQGILTDRIGHVMADESSHHTPAEIGRRKSKADDLRRSFTDERRSLAQIALRFALQTEGITTTIFSAVKVSELRENLGALECPALSEEEYEVLSSAGIRELQGAGVGS